MTSTSDLVNWPSRRAIVLALLAEWMILPFSAAAGTYYVDANSPAARDTNPGTEALPFKTIGKATSLVNAGDTVFVKAGVYRETVILSRSGTATTVSGRGGATTTTLPITLQVYPGHEGRAVINAAEPVTNWRQCTGPAQCAGNLNWEHIYWADVAALVQAHPDAGFAVRQVFQRGKLLPRSRYPDTGWSYPTRMPDPMKIFADDTLSQPNGYFTGAVCHVKTADWQIDQIAVASFSNAALTLAASPRYAITTRYGYYLTSIVGEINAEGEWAYDPVQKKIFLWPLADDPQEVEFSYRQYCLRSYGGTTWNVVRGLTMRHAHTNGLWLYRSHNMTLESNTIERAYNFGIFIQGATGGTCDHNQLLRNTVKYCGYYGIAVDGNASYTNVEGNYVYAAGVESFGGDLMNGRGEGIHVSGPYTRIYSNRIDRTAWASLYLQGPTLGREVSYNYATNAGLALADSGGIYTGGYSSVPEKDHIHHNIFADSLGCRSMDRNFDNGQPPTPSTHSGIMHGIYVDEEGNNRIIEYNTVINCRTYGVFFHWAPGNVVQHNTLYGNRSAQVFFNGDNNDRKRLINDVLLDNILFATASEQDTLYVGMNYNGLCFGQSDRNYFYNPYSPGPIFVNWLDPSTGIRTTQRVPLVTWQGLSGYDLHSKDFSYLEYRDGITLAEPRRSRIVYNPTLDLKTVDLGGDKYCDVDGRPVAGAVTLQPFESKILIYLGEPTLEPGQ